MENTQQKVKIGYVGTYDVSARIPIVRKLVPMGNDFVIIGSEGEEVFKKANIAYRKYRLNREFSIQSDLRSQKDLTKILEEEACQIVHSFDTKPNMLLPVAVRRMKKNRPKVVRTITGVGRIFTSDTLVNRLLRGLHNLIHRSLKSSIDMTIFQNQDDYDYFVTHRLVAKNKACIIKSSGIDLTQFNQQQTDLQKVEQLKAELNLKPNTLTFIFVGRLVYQKGVKELLNAARICKEKGRDFNFLLIGPVDTKHDAVSEEFVASFSDIVTYLGHRTDVRELLALSDVFVLPSFYREGVPRVLLEAAAMGLGIITTDMPGCNDVVTHGENGFLVPIKNAPALAQAMMDMASNPEQVRFFGANNKEKVKNFSLDKVTFEYNEIYKQIL